MSNKTQAARLSRACQRRRAHNPSVSCLALQKQAHERDAQHNSHQQLPIAGLPTNNYPRARDQEPKDSNGKSIPHSTLLVDIENCQLFHITSPIYTGPERWAAHGCKRRHTVCVCMCLFVFASLQQENHHWAARAKHRRNLKLDL